VGHYLELGLYLALVLDADSGDPAAYNDWGSSDWMIPRIAWFIGNEMDGGPPASWVMSPADYGTLWQRTAGLHGDRYVGGVCSGSPERARPYLQPAAAGLSVHLYTLSPLLAQRRLLEYKSALGVKLWVGETHPSGDYRLGDYRWDQVNVNDFCYSDAMVPGMGLYA